MPEATVVVPTHNRAQMLRRALASALGQEGVDHEVVVVDDGSADGTPRLLAELAAAEPRLTVLRHETPQGVARARNAGIDRARGEWTAFLDDDDVWAPMRLRAHLEQAGEGVALVYGSYVAVDAGLRPIRVVKAPSPEQVERRLLRSNPVGGPSTFTVRTSVLRDEGGFDESLSPFADWDLLIRAWRRGTLARSPEPLVGYVEHGENMMAKAELVEAEFRLLAEKHGDLAAAHGHEFGDAWLLAWQGMLARRSAGPLRAARLYARRAVAARRPKDLARAGAALLGDRGFETVRRALGRRARGVDWLALYR